MNELPIYQDFTYINIAAHMKFECKFIFPRFLNDEHYLKEREPIYWLFTTDNTISFHGFFPPIQYIKQLIWSHPQNMMGVSSSLPLTSFFLNINLFILIGG